MIAPRVRFAPSPTGQLHVGNARTALFNWLLARRHGGTLILRIEDTDTERSTLVSERAIVEDLRWLGLDWDEGPDTGGPYAPYRQSERLGRYQDAARRLLDEGRAYFCFCTPDQLEADRQTALEAGEAPKYVGRCRGIAAAEVRRRMSTGEAAATRFAVPEGAREITFTDVVRGDVTVLAAIIGDFVIVRSEGVPAYNFAVVVDDAAMQVSHVVRGEDHISNTPRQILIYEALGLTPPTFAHLSLVLGVDHAPLSKRHGATSVAEFRARGYLPEALINYLALLGWSPGDGEEIVPVTEMARRFDLTRVSHSAAVFDVDKLAWMNRQYMKLADPLRLAREAWPYFETAGQVGPMTDAGRAFVAALMPMAVGSVDRLEEIPRRISFLFDWEAGRVAQQLMVEPDGARVVAALAEVLGASPSLLDRESFRAATTRTRELVGLKGKALFHPVRVALTGLDSGPELDLAVPAIDRGATLLPTSGVARVLSCAERVRQIAAIIGPASSRPLFG